MHVYFSFSVSLLSNPYSYVICDHSSFFFFLFSASISDYILVSNRSLASGIYVHKTLVINKQFCNFSRVYYWKDPGDEGLHSLVVYLNSRESNASCG